MRSICLGLVILISYAFGACAQVTNAPAVGGPGGSPFDDACRPGDVMVGFNTTSGTGLDTIAAICQAQDDGVLVGGVYGLHAWGELHTDSGFADAPRCPADSAIYSLDVWVNKFNKLDSSDAICLPLRPDIGVASSLKRTYTEGVASRGSPSECPSDTIAVGITGRSGAEVDSVGLKCSPFPWHAIALVPPTPPPARPLADRFRVDFPP
jgi:hypothetical protein